MNNKELTISVDEQSSDSESHLSKRAWAVTCMIVLFATINWADKAIIGIVAQPLQEELGFTATQIGFAGSAFFFLFSISGALVGFLGDRFQIKWILFTLAALWGFIQFPIVLSGTYAVLILTRILLGAAEGPATAMANTAVFQWFPPKRRGFPAALVTAGPSLAKIAAAPTLALILNKWGWQACFVFMGIVSVIWCVTWFFIGKDGPYGKAATTQSSTNKRPRINTKVFKTRTFWGALISSSTVYGIVAASITWLPSFFEKGLGYSRLESGIMFGIPSIFAMIILFSVSIFTDKLSSRGTSSRITRVFTSAIFMIIGGSVLILLPFATSSFYMFLILIVGYGCVGVVIPLMNAVISQISPVQNIASTLGIFLALQNLSGLVSPTMVGYVVESAVVAKDGFALAYQIMGISIVIGGLLALYLMYPERDEQIIKAN